MAPVRPGRHTRLTRRSTTLLLLLRAGGGRGPHAEAARNMLLALLFAELLAASAHEGPPHAALRAPRYARPSRDRLPHRDTLAGRRPRG